MNSDGDWEKAKNEKGIPYYMNHKTEQTFWNHPTISVLEKRILSLGKIKYAAYRTALKLRAIQKATCSCNIQLSTIREYFEMQGMDRSLDLKETITAQELSNILDEIFLYEIKLGGRIAKEPRLASELMLNWLLNVHDSSRKGTMRFLSVKLSLIIVSSGSPRQKYHCIFSQIQNRNGFVDRERIGFFLQACLKIPKYLNEVKSFGDSSIEPSIKSFFKQAIDSRQAVSSDFVEWMLAEPQPLVWIPTLYRLAASETVKHEAKCNICKLFPLVGFRYKCLQCFNFDICQECFWTGRTSKSHKLEHPTQEYCLPSSQTSDLKDLSKMFMFKNKWLRSKKNKKNQASKKRYTEIPPDQRSIKSAPDYEGVNDNDDNDINDEVYSEPSNYRAASDYGEDRPDGIQNDRSVEDLRGENTWEPETQPLERPRSMESLRSDGINDDYSRLEFNGRENQSPVLKMPELLSEDQRRELDKVIASLEDDNRELQSEIQNIQSSQQDDEATRSQLYNENAKLRLEKRRMEQRQAILEEHNRHIEMQMQKLRVLLLQEREDFKTMMDIKKGGIDQRGETGIANRTLPTRPVLEPSSNISKGPIRHPRNTSTDRSIIGTNTTSSVTRLRIPSSILVKNSKITPIYEEIPDLQYNITSQPVARRTAWDNNGFEHEYDRLFDYQKHNRITGLQNTEPHYDGLQHTVQPFQNTQVLLQLQNEDAYRYKTSSRNDVRIREERSPEEQELDRTVQWAMDNFRCSETESNC